MVLYVRNTKSMEHAIVKISSFCLDEFAFIREEDTPDDSSSIFRFCSAELRWSYCWSGLNVGLCSYMMKQKNVQFIYLSYIFHTRWWNKLSLYILYICYLRIIIASQLCIFSRNDQNYYKIIYVKTEFMIFFYNANMNSYLINKKIIFLYFMLNRETFQTSMRLNGMMLKTLIISF